MKLGGILTTLLLVAVVVGVLFVRNFGAPRASVSKADDYGRPVHELNEIRPEARKIIAISQVYDFALDEFIANEGRAPADFAELVASPYMVAPSELLINPFTGKTVKNSVEPSAGDMNIHFAGPATTLDYWIRSLNDGRSIPGIVNSVKPRSGAFEVSATGRTGLGDPKQDINGLPMNDRRMYFICAYLNGIIKGAKTNQLDPMAAAHLDQVLGHYTMDGVVLLSPYTGGPLGEAASATPGPGKIVLEVATQDGSPVTTILCYGSDGKALSAVQVERAKNVRESAGHPPADLDGGRDGPPLTSTP